MNEKKFTHRALDSGRRFLGPAVAYKRGEQENPESGAYLSMHLKEKGEEENHVLHISTPLPSGFGGGKKKKG